MNDKITTLQQLKDQVASFVRERDWERFHSPKSLSMGIAVEAAELMEKFQWISTEESIQEVDHNRVEIEDEVADVMLTLLAFCNASKIDVSAAFERKLALTSEKYPVDKVKGRHHKYTTYQSIQRKSKDS